MFFFVFKKNQSLVNIFKSFFLFIFNLFFFLFCFLIMIIVL